MPARGRSRTRAEEAFMLVIAGRIRIDPEKRAAAVAAATAMMGETRREDGCISYTFSADLAEPGLFHIFEEWESQTALDAHFRSAHMASFQRAMGGFGVREMAVQRYEIARVGPLGG
jgi:quinol monooxygenase YgiN